MAGWPSSNAPSAGGRSTGPGPEGPDEAPGLGEQFGRTRSAFLGLIGAHVKLGRAELSEIGDQIKRAVAFGGIALFLIVLAAMLIVVGLLLFLGEVLFGSMGWGVLLGAELLIGTAALLVLAVIDLGWRRGTSAFVVALGIGLVVTGLLALDWSYISSHNSGLPSPAVLAVVAGAVVFAVVGAVLGFPFGRGAATGLLILGAVCGLFLGLLAAAGPGLSVAAAMGVAALLLFWPVVAAVLVFRHGIDTDKLKARFVPQQTIETTKETIEWVREQMPLGRKS